MIPRRFLLVLTTFVVALSTVAPARGTVGSGGAAPARPVDRAERSRQRPRRVLVAAAVPAPDGHRDTRRGSEGPRHQRTDLLLPRHGRTFHRRRGHGSARSGAGLGHLPAARAPSRRPLGEAGRQAAADVPGGRRQRRELRLRHPLGRSRRDQRHREPVGGRRQRTAHHLVPAVHEGLRGREGRDEGLGAVLQDRHRHRDRGRHRGRRGRQRLRRVGAPTDVGRLEVLRTVPDVGRGERWLRDDRQHRGTTHHVRAQGAVHRRRRARSRRARTRSSPRPGPRAGTCPASSPVSSTSTTAPARTCAPCSSRRQAKVLAPSPSAPGTPLGLGVAPDGTLYFADIGLVVSAEGVGPGDRTGSVRRIRFVDGAPQPPETMADGLAFPDGIGVFVPPRRR